MPNRTTRDYEGPTVAPRVQAALDAALQDEEDIDIDGRYAYNVQSKTCVTHFIIKQSCNYLFKYCILYCNCFTLFVVLHFIRIIYRIKGILFIRVHAL